MGNNINLNDMSGRIIRKVEVSPLPPILGKVKIGIKNPDRGFPMSVDYFVPTGKYASLFTQTFGEKPNNLLIYFPSDNADLVCIEQYVYRDNAGKKIASGDGEEFKVWSQKNRAFVRVSTEQVPDVMDMIAKKYPSQKGWEITLTIRFVLPQLGRIYGCWELTTKGTASSIPHLRDSFDALLEKNGHIAGVLFDLGVQFAKSDSPAGSRFPVLSLIPNETTENIEKIKAISNTLIEG